MDSTEIRKRKIFTSIGGDHFRNEDGAGLVGLNSRISRPKFIDSMGDLEFDSGIIHAIDRILIPGKGRMAPPLWRYNENPQILNIENTYFRSSESILSSIETQLKK